MIPGREPYNFGKTDFRTPLRLYEYAGMPFVQNSNVIQEI